MDGCGGRRRQREFIEEYLGQRGARIEPEMGWADRPGPVFSPVRPDLPPCCFSRFLEFMPNLLWVLDDVFPRSG
jgi:hypothetical protein